MKTTGFASLLSLGILSVACLAFPGLVCAQAPAGPLPQAESKDAPLPAVKPAQPVQPRTLILGAWKLNRDDSDDARKKMQSTRDRGDGGGGRTGGGYPGGRGGYGGYGGPGGMGRGESDADRERTQELFTPANAITLSMTGAEVDLVDDRNRKRAFITDGRKLQKSKGENYEEIAAKWEGNRLVTDEKSPRGGKMSRTFELSDDGRQLYETLHMTVGHNNSPLVIRYVYDIPAQTPQ